MVPLGVFVLPKDVEEILAVTTATQRMNKSFLLFFLNSKAPNLINIRHTTTHMGVYLKHA